MQEKINVGEEFKMAKRNKIGRYYVERRADGTFKKWTNIGRSLAADRRKVSKTKTSSGYGHKGDLKKSTRKMSASAVCKKYGNNSLKCKRAKN
jgi:hypothetical protein